MSVENRMKLCSLRSGSRGNAVLVYTDHTKILVDCGVSGKTVADSLLSMDIDPTELSAIVVTHEHRDHIAGIGVMTRRYGLPVYANRETWRAMEKDVGKIRPQNVRIFDEDQAFEIGDVGILPFSIPHDAANPVGYTFTRGSDKVAVATDIGQLQPELFRALRGSRAVLLEANHDVNLLEMGRYPLPLKRRIRGSMGHLSNDDAGKAAEFLVKLGARHIVLGHLSEENNYPQLALQTVVNVLNEAGIRLGEDVNLAVASRAAVGAAV